jgi:hypothetical protein
MALSRYFSKRKVLVETLRPDVVKVELENGEHGESLQETLVTIGGDYLGEDDTFVFLRNLGSEDVLAIKRDTILSVSFMSDEAQQLNNPETSGIIN